MARKLLTLALCIVAIEVVAFVAKKYNEQPPIIISDQTLNHIFAPNATYVDTARGVPNHVFTNSQSWAEQYDISASKPPGVYRIFYVGDSTTHGVVDDGNRVPTLVEQSLGKNYEVINAGTTSYSTLLYYLLIKNKILPFQPDLVILSIDMTDVRDDAVYRELAELDASGLPIAVRPSREEDRQKYILTPEGKVEIPRLTRIKAWLGNHSFILGSLYRFMHRKPPAIPPPGGWLAQEWNEQTQKDVAYSMSILTEIVRLLQSQGVRVMITGTPHYPQYTGMWSSKPHEILQSLAGSLHVPYLNSYALLEQKITGTNIDTYYWKTDPTHFNVQGNQLWAEAQINFLRDPKNDLLPVEPR